MHLSQPHGSRTAAIPAALVGSACSVMPDVSRRDSAGGESGSASAAPSPPAGVGILNGISRPDSALTPEFAPVRSSSCMPRAPSSGRERERNQSNWLWVVGQLPRIPPRYLLSAGGCATRLAAITVRERFNCSLQSGARRVTAEN